MDLTPQTIDKLSTELAAGLAASAGTREGQIRLIVTTLSRTFNVELNEVALYRLDDERGILKFLWPEKLRQVGAIPFSSNDSLAARTAREGEILLENAFAARRHANAFEKIRLTPGIAAPPKPIQKIISAPVLNEGVVRGVIQLSRKGDGAGPEIPDFTDADADALFALSEVIGEHL